MQKGKKKSTKIILTVLITLFVLIVSFFIYTVYEAGNFFYKHNKPGDLWVNEEYGITVKYVSGEPKNVTLLQTSADNELETATIDGIDAEFRLDLGPGHAKQFNFYDDKRNRYVLYGEYEMHGSNTCEIWFYDMYDSVDTFDKCWSEYDTKIARKFKKIVDSEKHIYLKKTT